MRESTAELAAEAKSLTTLDPTWENRGTPFMPCRSGCTATRASWESSLNTGHHQQGGSIETAPCSPFAHHTINSYKMSPGRPFLLPRYGALSPSLPLLPEIKPLQFHEIDQESIARTSGSLRTTTQRKRCLGERKRCLVYGLYRLLPGKSRTQTSYNQPMWDEREKRDVRVREIMSGIYYSFTGVPPCGASWRATRDPRTDRHPT